MNWWKDLRSKVKLNEPLKDHTTLKIGGPAKYFIEPKDIKHLKLLLNLLKGYKISFLIIGKGSNILVSDKGINAAVICLNSAAFKKVVRKNNYLHAGSAAALSQIIRIALKNSLSGVEFLTGIPGTLGGALIMNAGIPNEYIGDLVKDITVMDYRGNIKALAKKDIKFGYRSSNLTKYIILGARIKLIRKNRKEIKEKINRYLKRRIFTQELSWPSAGCIFKNPPGDSAGRLIDLCGLKKRRIKDAMVSEKHANFILNLGRAKTKDVLALMALMRKKVKNKFNITLEPEIKIWL